MNRELTTQMDDDTDADQNTDADVDQYHNRNVDADEGSRKLAEFGDDGYCKDI
jgi:hypothetical protein